MGLSLCGSECYWLAEQLIGAWPGLNGGKGKWCAFLKRPRRGVPTATARKLE